MSTLPNMQLDLPVRGQPGAGRWGDTLDSDLRKIDAHDHSPGKGAQVPSAGLNINADIPFSALYAPTQLHRIQFSQIAGGALTGSQNLSLFVSDGTGGLAAGELYYRTGAGNAVRFTNGNALNVQAFVGGIGGDYNAVNAQLNYDDAGKRYTFAEGSGDSHGWARLAAGGLRLFEFNTTEAVFVEQLCPPALSVSYSMTWPTALPGSAQIAQIDNTGQWSFTNTVSQAVTLSGGIANNVTLTSGATGAVNQHVVLSGSGTYKHGTKSINHAPHPFEFVGSSGTVAVVSGQPGAQIGASSVQFWQMPSLPAHARITTIEVWFSSFAQANNAVVSLVSSTSGTSGSTITATFSAVAAPFSTAGATNIQSSSGLTLQPSNSQTYWLKFDTTSSAATAYIVSSRIFYDVP